MVNGLEVVCAAASGLFRKQMLEARPAPCFPVPGPCFAGKAAFFAGRFHASSQKNIHFSMPAGSAARRHSVQSEFLYSRKALVFGSFALFPQGFPQKTSFPRTWDPKRFVHKPAEQRIFSPEIVWFKAINLQGFPHFLQLQASRGRAWVQRNLPQLPAPQVVQQGR
jgi:hypothetical protein